MAERELLPPPERDVDWVGTCSDGRKARVTAQLWFEARRQAAIKLEVLECEVQVTRAND